MNLTRKIFGFFVRLGKIVENAQKMGATCRKFLSKQTVLRDLPKKLQNKVDFCLTMWYGTVKPLESEILPFGRDSRTERPSAAKISGYLFAKMHKNIKFLRKNPLPYGETDKMDTTAGKMQDCACFFSEWAVYLLYVNILLPYARHKYYKRLECQPKF